MSVIQWLGKIISAIGKLLEVIIDAFFKLLDFIPKSIQYISDLFDLIIPDEIMTLLIIGIITSIVIHLIGRKQ